MVPHEEGCLSGTLPSFKGTEGAWGHKGGVERVQSGCRGAIEVAVWLRRGFKGECKGYAEGGSWHDPYLLRYKCGDCNPLYSALATS